MLYPNVIEISRAGSAMPRACHSQRELVALSLRLKPPAASRSFIDRDKARGIFR